jgi:hypothetical protein
LRRERDAAVIFAGLGDKDRCLEALDRGATAGPCRIAWVLAFPEYRVLRGDPRVKDLRKKVGLPEYASKVLTEASMGGTFWRVLEGSLT